MSNGIAARDGRRPPDPGFGTREVPSLIVEPNVIRDIWQPLTLADSDYIMRHNPEKKLVCTARSDEGVESLEVAVTRIADTYLSFSEYVVSLQARSCNEMGFPSFFNNIQFSRSSG